MDPTSRRLITRIAAWTGAILVLMAIYYFAIRPQLQQPADSQASEDIIVPEESSGEEGAAEGGEVTTETGEAEPDRTKEGEAIDEDAITDEDTAAPEASEPKGTTPSETM